MERFTTLTSIVAPLPMVNIDTDMLIPKQFLKTTKRGGLGKNLFYELRYDQNGHEKPEFVLNLPAYRHARILATGENFGCGSSREHAQWALSDFGIRCLIASKYADIFFNNCIKNAILPVILPQKQVDILINMASSVVLTIDLEQQKIYTSNDIIISFTIDPFQKRCLLEGLDEIGLTLERKDKISIHEERSTSTHSWL